MVLNKKKNISHLVAKREDRKIRNHIEERTGQLNHKWLLLTYFLVSECHSRFLRLMRLIEYDMHISSIRQSDNDGCWAVAAATVYCCDTILLLNGECQLFAATIFKAIRWFNLQQTVDSNGHYKAEDETNKNGRPYWCCGESNTINCWIETFATQIRLCLLCSERERENESIFGFAMSQL